MTSTERVGHHLEGLLDALQAAIETADDLGLAQRAAQLREMEWLAVQIAARFQVHFPPGTFVPVEIR